MEIRLAHPNELNRILSIIQGAKETLAAAGIDQWQNGYPNEEVIFEDILENRGYVGLVDHEVVAYAALYKGNEAPYQEIYDGKWLHDNYLYVVLHRIAVDREHLGQGLAQTFLQGLIEGEQGPDFRCDTHPDNLTMQHLLEKLGFVYCGKVPVDGVRLAYQKIKGKNEKSLFQVVNEEDRWMLGSGE